MRIAYLVLTHRNPQLLKRTIQALSSDDCAFFIHVDKKSEIADFSEIKGDNVFFIQKRIPVYWGEFSGVRAMMLLMRQALEAPESYDYFVHLSGSDYPLRSRAYIHSYFEANRGSEFITLLKVPAPGKPLSRIANVRYESDKPVRRFLSKGLAKVGLAGRNYKRHLGDLEPYSGRALWALSRSACCYVLDFIAKNPAVEKFFENTFAPDEAFFHTILANSEFGPRARGNLVFEDWSARGAHPEMIGASHVAWFGRSQQVFENGNNDAPECLFARKFFEQSHELFDSLDEMIVRKDLEGLPFPLLRDRIHVRSRLARAVSGVQSKQPASSLGGLLFNTSLACPLTKRNSNRNCCSACSLEILCAHGCRRTRRIRSDS